MQSDTVAAILGGGAGARMGGRKALVVLDGEPLVAHVARAMRPSAEKLAMVGDAEAAETIRADALRDPPGFPAGPLSGVRAALEWATRENAAVAVIAPCDTPLRTELTGSHPPVRDVLAKIGFKPVRFVEADVFLNVNTPEDLRRTEAILRARR